MITVKNLGSQTEELIFSNEGKYVHYFLPPKQSVTVPSSFKTNIVEELARRHIISIKTVG